MYTYMRVFVLIIKPILGWWEEREEVLSVLVLLLFLFFCLPVSILLPCKTRAISPVILSITHTHTRAHKDLLISTYVLQRALAWVPRVLTPRIPHLYPTYNVPADQKTEFRAAPEGLIGRAISEDGILSVVYII